MYHLYFPTDSSPLGPKASLSEPTERLHGKKRIPIWGWIIVIVIIGVLIVWLSQIIDGQRKIGGIANREPSTTLADVAIEGETPVLSTTPTLAIQSTQTLASSRIPTISPSSPVTASSTVTPSSTPTATFTPEPQAGDIRVVVRGGLEVEQVYVPAGEFVMGSTDVNDPAALDDEKPQRTVYIDAFWIDRTETTNHQYAMCHNAGSCIPPTLYSSASRPSYYYMVNLVFADYPVVYIDWIAADAYCSWADARLPTEAEWEKAARGTDARIFPWGNDSADCDLANYNLCVGDTTAVGIYPEGASPYGALDMAGNVWEWVEDGYQINYYSVGPAINPLGPNNSGNKVLRGGAWTHREDNVRSAFRLNDFPQNDYYNFGIRCASD